MLHQVGVGALGPVFRTYEPTRDRLVAVKVFRLDITPEQAAALADELGRAAEAGLFHPSIVEPIAAGLEGSSAYRADEYVAAETLDVAMRHYAPAPVERILPFITQLAGAIDFARTAGIGHGALHPRDIFVTPEEARAGGFGVVGALERVGVRAPVRRPYTAPERIAGAPWDVAADVFSLAVITYELLTGRRPSGTGEQVSGVSGPHAAAVRAVIVRAMSEDPARRHPSALAFAAELDAASKGESTTAAVAALVPPREDVAGGGELVDVGHEDVTFRAEPERADTLAERDDEIADVAFTSEEQLFPEERDDPEAFGADRPLFDFEPGIGREAEQFADEFALAANRLDSVIEPRSSGDRRTLPSTGDLPADEGEPAMAVAPPEPLSSYATEPVVIREGRGIGVVPVAVTVFLALLVGFAAGWSVRERTLAPLVSETPVAATSGTPAQEPAPAKPMPQAAGEQVMNPTLSQPPQPAAEAPARELPAPPSPAPTSGSVEVRSTPSRAGVTLDGRWWGRTPLTIDRLRFGRHTIRVVEPGYVTAREEVTLSSSRPSRELSFTLKRMPPPATAKPAPREAPPRAAQPDTYTGSIYVDSRPRGARVLVDGKFIGTTPIRIPDIRVGSHVVRLQLTDHADWTAGTRVSAGQESRVTGSLERIR